ncbi:lantibiotic dehydratase [Streptomyces armeniacus]|uniref:Lantibiotic dehydratase n=2 Tax=Streptomyces armeniacus TaxID=83291 RepID=A0A345Y1Q3_9ACTN|nr:lantibiotic dehydratase [Streptomyces armeniacus]
MSDDHVAFQAEPVGMLRVPLLSRAGAVGTYADVDPRDPDQVRRYVDGLAADEGVAEALAVSSPSLSRSVEAVRGEVPLKPKALRKLALSATRYVLRAASRATPFGLLAGVAPVAFAEDCRVRMGSAHRKAVRPDSAWLFGLIRGWEGDFAVVRKLRVVTNDLGCRRGQRWVLPFASQPEESDGDGSDGGTGAGGAGAMRAEEVSVRFTAAVRTALHAAEHPRTVEDVLAVLDRAYPKVPAAAKEKLLLGLVRQDFLLTELRPPLSETDPLRHVVDTLKHAGESDKARELAALADLHQDYAAQPIGTGGAALRRKAVDAANALHSEDPSLHVDMRLDADVTLPYEVLRETERAAAALWRAAPDSVQPPHLREYHGAFVERYGTDQAVPLRDVLDPQAGIGPPAGYLHPRSERRTPERAEPSARDRARDSVLTELALAALASGDREISLDEGVLEWLGGRGPSVSSGPSGTGGPSGAGGPSGGDRAAVPGALEVCAHLTAPSQEALGRGDFALVVSPGTGSFSPGSLLGRFAYLLDDQDVVGDLARRSAEGPGNADRTAGGGAVSAGLEFAPPLARSVNVARVGSFWPERIAVGCFADRSLPAVRGLGDLALVADLDRLYVVDARTGQEISAQFPSMLDLRGGAPAAVRLVLEVSRAGREARPVWMWGAAGSFPWLPRVRYGRTVLAPARWRFSDPALTDSSVDDAEWARRLATWRERWHVPDRVAVGVGDRRTELDLTAPLHRMLLRRELARHEDLLAYETPEDAGAGAGWLTNESGAFTSELVLPLFPTARAQKTPAAPRPRRRVFPSVAAPAPRHDREWLYGKLYASVNCHNQILTEHLPRLLAELPRGVDRWFFIRYADTDGAQLRLRFHGEPSVLHPELTPVFLDWVDQLRSVRLAGAFVLDGYEPEAARYGGTEAMAAAERVFHRDSVAVLEQLRLQTAGSTTVEPPVLAAANYLDMVRRFHGGDWPGFHLATPRDDEHHAYFREHRAAALPLLGNDVMAAAFRAGAAEVTVACEARAAALREYAAHTTRASAVWSVLHMHHNRLIGTDRKQEQRSLAVSRGLAQVEQGRRRHLG